MARNTRSPSARSIGRGAHHENIELEFLQAGCCAVLCGAERIITPACRSPTGAARHCRVYRSARIFAVSGYLSALFTQCGSKAKCSTRRWPGAGPLLGKVPAPRTGAKNAACGAMHAKHLLPQRAVSTGAFGRSACRQGMTAGRSFGKGKRWHDRIISWSATLISRHMLA